MDLKKIKYIASKTLRKNLDDLTALASGGYPGFVYRKLTLPGADQIPVFTFHRLEPVSFEAQLKHLAQNHYKTLSGDEFLSCLTGVKRLPPKAVLLTFDDCWGSLWAVAHPLLKKYGLQGVAFAISDAMEQGDGVGATLEDVWAGTRSMDEILGREVKAPLCNWAEIKRMSRAGTLEFQSHSRMHHSVYIDSEVVDFVNPDRYPSFMFSDFNPLINLGANEVAEWDLDARCYGEPIYPFRASFAARRRFIPNHQVSAACRAYVTERGGKHFFQSADWRKELMRVYTN
ncbi:polysaccharide deacetylase family protein, partial [Ketobacter sp.]